MAISGLLKPTGTILASSTPPMILLSKLPFLQQTANHMVLAKPRTVQSGLLRATPGSSELSRLQPMGRLLSQSIRSVLSVHIYSPSINQEMCGIAKGMQMLLASILRPQKNSRLFLCSQLCVPHLARQQRLQHAAPTHLSRE